MGVLRWIGAMGAVGLVPGLAHAGPQDPPPLVGRHLDLQRSVQAAPQLLPSSPQPSPPRREERELLRTPWGA